MIPLRLPVLCEPLFNAVSGTIGRLNLVRSFHSAQRLRRSETPKSLNSLFIRRPNLTYNREYILPGYRKDRRDALPDHTPYEPQSCATLPYHTCCTTGDAFQFLPSGLSPLAGHALSVRTTVMKLPGMMVVFLAFAVQSKPEPR
jgi:hypothetical protein